MESFRELERGDIIRHKQTDELCVVVQAGDDAVQVEPRDPRSADAVYKFDPWGWDLSSTAEGYKPPLLGLRPKHIVDEQRAEEILDAMLRYVHAGKFKDIPEGWFYELNDLRGFSKPGPIFDPLRDYNPPKQRPEPLVSPWTVKAKPWNQPGIVFCGTTPSGDPAP